MSPSLSLALLCGVLLGTGTILLLSRALVRALLGVMLMSNGVNVLYIIASGRAGDAPLVDGTSNPPIGTGEMADPLPQAMVLTAIVITLAVTAFTLALAHRAVELQNTDVVVDDEEGRRAHERAMANDLSDSDYQDTSDPYSVDEEHAWDEDERPPGPAADRRAAPDATHVPVSDPSLPADSPGGRKASGSEATRPDVGPPDATRRDPGGQR